MALPSSPNLMDFGDSPRAVAAPVATVHHGLVDPFAVAHATTSDDPFAVNISSSSTNHHPTVSTSLASANAKVATATAATTTTASSSSSVKPVDLHFFVSCMGVEGNSIQATPRSAQTLMRGALSMLSQSTSTSKTKSPRGKPPTEVSVEVRITREFALIGHEPMSSSLALTEEQQQQQQQQSQPLIESESYWSERRKSRNPHFAVGFNIQCHVAAMRDRHVQVMIMIPEEGSHSNKNAQLFGYAQATFQELFTIATSSGYQQKMTLPVHSTVMDGATVEIRFANVAPLKPQLFDAYNSIFRSYLFYHPFLKDDKQPQGAAIAVAPKLALEEACEVDLSVKIPSQLLRVCQVELTQMYHEWRERYNFNRKKNRFFENDAEALNFGHDIFRVQVVSGRNLAMPNSGGGGGLDGGNGGRGGGGGGGGAGGAARPSTFSLAGGRAGGLMNRLKNQAGKYGGTGSSNTLTTTTAPSETSSSASSPLNTFVVVKICDGNGATQEHTVGKTNTEYESCSPVFSMNKSPQQCPHGKPNTKMCVSPVLPSRTEVSQVNQLKQFLFYRPSLARQGLELSGWLRLEVYNESYGIMSGIENELLGEIMIPLQSLRDAMAVEETIVWENRSDGGSQGNAHSVHSLTLVDWFDIRHPSSDDSCGGQLQLRLHILLANPMVESVSDLIGDGSDPVLSPRRQRLAKDAEPPTSNALESEMALAFLYPHVMTLHKQIMQVNEMIRLCDHLVSQKKTFKSSQHKKRADIQGIPTNLHVSYFRILRHFGQTNFGPGAARTGGDRRASTEDLLGIESPRTGITPPPATGAATGSSVVQDRWLMEEVHATVTCGAPTAHAMGLSEYGLREMELEIHRLQGILDRCNPRVTTTTTTGSGKERDRDQLPEYITEEAAEYAFSSLPDDLAVTNEEEDDEEEEEEEEDSNNSSDGGGGEGDGPSDKPPIAGSDSAASSPGSVDTSPQAATVAKPKKKYSNLATRAVAGAKKAATRSRGRGRHTKKDKSSKTLVRAATSGDSGDSDENAVEIKYPPLKTEPDDGMDPTTSIRYAVRVLCRLEMLRAEYYLRKSVAVSQSVSSLVTCFVSQLDLWLRPAPNTNTGVLTQLAQIGFLIGWESLISSHGKELRMLSDAWVAIKCLETFAFQLVQSQDQDQEQLDGKDVVLEKRQEVGYTILVPIPKSLFALLPQNLQNGQLIKIHSVLFTQGINEMQSLANMVGHSGVSIQTKINTSSFRSIVEYYNTLSKTGMPLSESFVGSQPEEILRNLRMTVEQESSSSKNTNILFHAADAVRSLNGGRITYCKSGKDRTAMSVTLEQAKLLVQRKRHVLEELLEASTNSSPSESGPLEEVKDAANTMREFGVRMEIAKKNVGRYKYSFNTIQRKLLPEIYRPPISTVQDLVTSVTARDS